MPFLGPIFMLMMVAAAAFVFLALIAFAAAAFMMVMLFFQGGELMVEVSAQALDIHADLLLGGEVLDLNFVLVQIVLTGDDGEFRVGASRFFEHGAKFSTPERHFDGIAFAPQHLGQSESIVLRLFADRHHVEVDAMGQ